MNIYKGLFVSAIVVMAIYVGVAIGGGQGGGVPTWLNYQGRLTAPTGAAVADDSYNAIFRIYTSATGGSPLWTEVQQIATKGGVYSTTLGKATPFPTDLFTRPLWLESEIDGRVLTPRQELGAVAFAMTALTVPDGSITSAKIGNGQVNTADLADNSVTATRLAADTASVEKISAGRIRVSPAFASVNFHVADLNVGGIRRPTPGRALVDDGNKLVVNYGNDWLDGVDVRSDLTVGASLIVGGGPTAGSNVYGTERLHIQSPSTIYLNPYSQNGDVWVGGGSGTHHLTVAGNVYAQAFVPPSNRRLKDNITPIANPLEKILKLQGVDYTLKSSKHREIGFIAEDMAKVVPQVVAKDADGKEIAGIDYARLTALLVEGMKEQQKQIEALERKIAQLERK